MAESKKTSKATPIADVAQPGKSAPTDTSRSIIINHSLLQDPMMVEQKTPKTSEEVPAAKAKVSHEAILQPLEDTPAPAEQPDPSKDQAIADTPPSSKPDISPPVTSEPEKITESKADEPSPAAEQKAQELDVEAEQAAAAEHEAAIQKIIDSKKYFLPINSVEKRRSARFVAIGIFLALVLGVAWVDIALDASLIQIHGIKPVTHLFSS